MKTRGAPSHSIKLRKVIETQKLAPHWTAAERLMPSPLTDKGNISAIINQNNEPTLMQYPAI